MFNFLVKNPTDLLFGRRLWTAMGSFLVSMSQKRYNRPVEVCFLCLNYIFWLAVLLFKIRGLDGSQKGANIHMSVPISLQYPPTNLYTSVVHFILFRRLVEYLLQILPFKR